MQKAPAGIYHRLGLTRMDSGMHIPGKYVWCSSVIRVGDRWHMFSAAWPERNNPNSFTRGSLLQGYLEQSVIVRGEADNPEGPYEYKETVLEPRGSGFWDVICCHNPFITRINDRFYLFFQTCGKAGEPRRIGYASATDIRGPWIHAKEAIPFPWDSVNPSVLQKPSGELLMVFRREPMRLALAKASTPEGPWEVIIDDLMPYYRLEDPCFFFWQGQYHMLLEDCGQMVTGDRRNGVHMVSDDAIDWHFYEPEIRAYGPRIDFSNGVSAMALRRERPFLLFENGEPAYLVSGVLFENFKARSIVTPIEK